MDYRSEPGVRPVVGLVMGPAGAGKTTVGRLVATRTGASFADADDFHDEEAKLKMARGVPLDDADRAPWLARLAAHLSRERSRGIVLACSALKARYRSVLREAVPELRIAYLDVPEATLRARLHARTGHYAGPGLLESQLAALEAPGGSESFDGTEEPGVLAARIASAWSKDTA